MQRIGICHIYIRISKLYKAMAFTFRTSGSDSLDLTIKNTLMKCSQLLLLLGLLLCLASCSSEFEQPELQQEDIIGHWNLTVPSGLQFIEFISEGKMLIGDRGAMGQMDVSKHYLQDYTFDSGHVTGLPAGARMENISVIGDRMTFDFINTEKGINYEFTAYREDEFGTSNLKINMLNQVWETVEQDGQPISKQNKKVAYFSKAGIYALTNPMTGQVDMFSWEWDENSDNELCYEEYQRPKMVPQQNCMTFKIITEAVAIFEVDGMTIRLEAKQEI